MPIFSYIIISDTKVQGSNYCNTLPAPTLKILFIKLFEISPKIFFFPKKMFFLKKVNKESLRILTNIRQHGSFKIS
jgi:hypothetical protein